MIKGKTLTKRDVFDKPGGKVTGRLDANVEILASENRFQWLCLANGGWVNAGILQQYIKWQTVPDAAPLSQPPTTRPGTGASIIKGRTLVKRDILDKPVNGKAIGRLDANVEILASENRFQWLHLVNGGWVNAGPSQQYIKWQATPAAATPPPAAPGADIPPPQPDVPSPVTEIKRMGRIATLLVDWQNPKWEFAPRNVGPLNAYPQTVTFSHVCDHRKGPRIPLTDAILEYVGRLNGERIREQILIPDAGWINNPTIPPTIERITWAANHVIVKETRIEDGVVYCNVHASSCYATDLSGTFFDLDMRLVVHKFNAFTQNRTMIKLGNGINCYTPFISDPHITNGDMWIRSDYLEMWPSLPFVLADGTVVAEYELHGYRIYGRQVDGSAVLLRDPSGFKTNWRINSPEVPV